MNAIWFSAVVALTLSARADATIERHRIADAGDLLALRDGELLVWNERGRAFLRNASGEWTDGLQLPLAHVWALIPDGSGFLASGATGDDKRIVIQFDQRGRELQRWTPSRPGWDLLVDGARRWYIQPGGSVELLAGGQLGPLESLPDGPGGHPQQPRVLAYQGRRLICYGARRFSENRTRAGCRRSDREAWAFHDPGGSPPIGCGPWVIAAGRGGQQLVVRSFDGRVVGRRVYPARPAVACVGSGALAVGAGRLVQVVRLPAQSPVWTHRVGRGTVVTVAATKDLVAFGTDASDEVVVVHR